MPSRIPATALLIVALVGGCTTTAPSPSPSPVPTLTAPSPTATPPGPTATPRPLAEVYAEIRTQVEGIRGLEPTKAVEPVVIDAATLATNL